MAKDNSKELGSHVRFTKGDNRPYVRAADLFKSEKLQRTVENARKELGKTRGAQTPN